MIRGEARAENEAQVTSLLWEFIRKDGLKGESIEEESVYLSFYLIWFSEDINEKFHFGTMDALKFIRK
ncbi:hypothetical protein TIFTF001_030646 [Ficus carica]|uniref:Uncharacterized protein n=1 Tax=Ficus carica TaxID=3494 RepID=A0AA88J440_FICCA|nr:hypothetical protein TIFTF001_030646 [Ficus carica]